MAKWHRKGELLQYLLSPQPNAYALFLIHDEDGALKASDRYQAILVEVSSDHSENLWFKVWCSTQLIMHGS